jgi:hypothetical protein
MFISKKHIPRRAFLRGVGTTLALPFIESMLPAATSAAQAAETFPMRFCGMFIPHGAAPGYSGMQPDYWKGKNTGAGVEFPFVYKPLEPFRKKVLLTSGLWSEAALGPPGVTGQDHFVAASFMCARKPKKTTGADVRAGTTIDQVIAKKIGGHNLLPSLQMAVEDPGSNGGTCGEGYSCVYTNTISWASPTQPLPMELNPKVIFERMYGSGGTPAERQERRAEKSSVLDSVLGSLSSLEKKVGYSDRQRLDQYTNDVREIERRLDIAAKTTTNAPDMKMPAAIPESWDEHIKLHFDLLALAFQADISRVGSMLFARDLTNRVFPESGVKIAFHAGSHHAGDPGRIAQYARLNRYHVSMVAYLAKKLDSIPEGDGTLLDHSLLLYGSDMGNSNQHLHYDVPHVLVGGANGQLKGDRVAVYKSQTVPTGNLMLSILDLYGIHMDKFGDSEGRLDAVVKDARVS